MTWGVVAAIAPELRPTLRALRARRRRAGRRTFHVAGPFVFALSGIGTTPAAACAADLFERFDPRVLVSTGFAGSLLRDLEIGTILLGGVPGLPASEEALRQALAADRRARVGTIVSADRVLLEASEREDAVRRGAGPASGVALVTNPIGVDMESTAIGRLARERGADFLCVKAVLDTPGAPLASRYESLVGVLGEIVRRPALLSRILDDARRSRTAARSLAEFYRALEAVLRA